MPGGFVCSGTMKQALAPTAVKSVVSGKKSVRKLFSKEQRAFFAEHAPEGIELDDLSLLGPIFVLKLKYSPKGFGASSSPSCGSIRMTAGSSSCPRNARRRRPSRSRPRRGRT